MEGITWAKILAIVALFAGSLYVLLPTALQGDLEAAREAAAASVKAPGSDRKGADLEVRFTSGAPADDAAALKRRLDAASIGVDRVSEKDGQVVVTLKPGTSREDVVGFAKIPGSARVYAPDTVSPVPDPVPALGDPPDVSADLWGAVSTVDAARAGHWANVLPGWALAPVPNGATPLPLVVQGLDAGHLTLSAGLPDGVPFVVVGLDGKMVGLGIPGDTGVTFARLERKILTSDGTSTSVADERAAAVLAGGPLSAPLVEVLAEADAKTEDAPAVVESQSTVPAWLLAMLPDTIIQRGLDLQGGLDLTLQVELDDAVLSQVARDATALGEAAKRANVTVVSVRRDKTEPMIWFETPNLQEIQDFLRETNRDYVYAESDGERHAFALNEVRIEAVQTQAVEQVLETLRKRVDATGVKEPSIVKKGGGRINVQLPGEVDLQAAIDAIGTTAVLEFYMVDPKFDRSSLVALINAAERALPPDQFADDRLVNDWLWETKRLPEDRVIKWHYEETTEGMKRITYDPDGRGPLPLVNTVELTGNDVNDASVGFDQNNMPDVRLGFKPRGSQIFCDLTTAHVGEQFAIVLDGQVRSAPGIRERICGGRASIEMGNSLDALQDANTLALVLRTGSLDAPVSIGEVRQVGAQLGRDSIYAGSIASAFGGTVVLVFMGVWYRRAGVLADVALVLNVLMVLAALALFGATLTLPGIAGIALTMGMAVDANIIVFERIKEELRMGVAPRKAVEVGFEKALSAVLDANITTAIAGIVLFSYGSGPIKGFAVTLLIGIGTTLVTAIFVTRTLMELVTRSSSARITI